MRGPEAGQGKMFSYVSLETRIPQDHPLRLTRKLVDEALARLSPLFDEMYSPVGRRSIAPERLLRALLLQVLYSVRSERQLMEQLDYNLLFRWFVGLGMDDAVWDASTFSKNRDRLLDGDVAQAFFREIVRLADQCGLLSPDHFTVDGTLLQAWASQKSFQAKEPGEAAGPSDPEDPGNPSVDFRGDRRRNDTHASTTDPEARLFKKARGAEARLGYLGHLLVENRHGLVVEAEVSAATGRAEREVAARLIRGRRGTLAADRGYDTREFVGAVRAAGMTPHVAQKARSAIDRRTTRHEGYRVSQRVRKRVEEVFGWAKTVGPLRQVKVRGQARVNWLFTFVAAAYDLVRIRNVLGAIP